MLELQVYHIPWCLWCKPPGNLVCTCDVIWFRSHSSDCRKMAEYMVRHSSVSLSVITFSTQNILELYFGRWKVIFWLIIGALFIVTVAFHFNNTVNTAVTVITGWYTPAPVSRRPQDPAAIRVYAGPTSHPTLVVSSLYWPPHMPLRALFVI